MKKSFFSLAISLIFLCPSVSAKKISISILKDRISNQESKINVLAAEIRDLDERISTNNEHYLKRIREIEEMESKIDILRGNLSKSADDVSSEYAHSKKAFDMYLLEVSDNENDNQLEHNLVYGELLKKKLSSLKEAHENSQGLLSSINSYDQMLLEKRKNEESIYGLIIDLEKQKKNISQKYLTLKESKGLSDTLLEKALIKRKARKKTTKKISRGKSISSELIKQFDIGLPLDSFEKISNDKKGITFKFKKTLPVKSPGTGKIVYAGELASYGKVIMVDHGNDVRSVLLGDIVVKVSKGDFIKGGDIIGYTISDQAVQNTLYFEIRKKNIAQNTSRWIANKDNLRI